MADYSELKQNIASVIKSNNRREITGQILQNVLNQMVGSLGENYQLAGFAEPTTNPQQPDQTLFYIAEQAGVYTNFDNITLGDGLSFLMWKNSEWTSHTIGVATHSWVDSNYVSKAFLRQIFRVYDADGFEILPNDTTSIADNIKAMVGLWTNEYLSALGLGDDGQTGAQYLTQLGDVDIDSTTLADGQVLVYDNGLWVNGQAGGVDMSVVWAALAGNTNEQINASHLTTALTGYVTSSSLSTTLADYVTTKALNTALASYASQSWVSQNYVSIAFLNRILRAYDSTDTQVQPNDTTTAIDNLKAMVGLWTEQYLSALGQGNDGGGGGYITTLGQLEDVLLTTPSVGQALVYAEVESGVYKWVNGTAGVDMSSVWTALAGGTNEQIALSHLTTALSGYVTTSGLSTTLADYVTATALSTTLADYVTAASLSTTLASYATQQWVGQNYISIAFFNRLFAAYDSNNVIINPNDTTTAVDNIKALVGLWTQQYLSALGQGSDGGVVTSLANLTDVDLGSTINNNDVLTYDSSTNKWTNKPAQGGSTVAALEDLTDVGISSLADKDILQYDYTNNVWKNVTLATALSGYATTSQLSSYLPLSGGTLSGNLLVSADKGASIGSSSARFYYGYLYRIVGVQSLSKGTDVNTYRIELPDKSGTIAVTSDLNAYNPTNNFKTVNGYSIIGTGDINVGGGGGDYLPLSGGTLSGILKINVANNYETGSISSKAGLGVGQSGGDALWLGCYPSYYGWIQASYYGRDGYPSSTYVYPLILQPIGGKVGIGKNNPSYTLDVNGSVYADSFIKKNGTSSQFLKADGSVDSNAYITSSSLSGYVAKTGDTMTGTLTVNKISIGVSNDQINCSANLHLNYGANTNISLCAGSTGNVGVGTTVPAYKLDVVGDINVSSKLIISQSGGIYSGPSSASVRKIYGCDSSNDAYSRMASYAMLPDNDSDDAWQVRPMSGAFSDAYITVLHGGNVGIGTTTPSSLLHVNGVARVSKIRIGEGVDQINSDSGLHLQYANTTSGMSLCAQGGNVGVGTLSPSYLLHVNGSFSSTTAYISSFLKVETGDTHNISDDMHSAASMCVGEYEDDAIWIGRINASSVGFIQCSYKNASLARYALSLQPRGGNVGIQTTAPSYALHVAGDIYATGGVTSLSDIRKKDVVSYELPLSVEQIANAPTIKFLWKDKREEGEQVGTIAQYWEKVLPQAIKSKSGELSMSYGVAALIAATIGARKIVDHEKRLDEQDALIREQGIKISELQNECADLRRENEMLKLKIA